MDNRADFSNYDPVAFAAEVAAAEEWAKTKPTPEEIISPWRIVMSADLIQWNNNLFKESAAKGFSWDLNGIGVIVMAKQEADAVLEQSPKLWIIDMGGSLVSIRQQDTGSQLLLAFQQREEVDRFVDGLEADGHEQVEVELLHYKEIERLATAQGAKMGLVPPKTLVSPNQFGSNI